MLHRMEINSEILDTTCRLAVYIPEEDHNTNPLERLPAIYIFRGDCDEWLNPHQDESRQGRNAITVLEDLRHKGYLPPVALVFPTTANAENGVFSGGFDFVAPPGENLKNIGTGKFEQFVIGELIPNIENEFPIGGEPGLRALDGFSLGGLIAFVLGLKYPDRFAAIGCYDGAFLFWTHDHPDGVSHLENDLRLNLFPYWFGMPPDFDHFQRNNPANIIFNAGGEHLAKIRNLPMYLQTANDQTPNANQWRVERFIEMLAHIKIRNGFEQSLLNPHARHNWYWADEHLYYVLPRLCRHMKI